MKNTINYLGTILTLLIFAFQGYSQGPDCENADPLCTDSPQTFPAGVNSGAAQPGPSYGCLGSQPNPAWYFLNIDQPGPITLTMTPQPLVDIDYILWGPFPDVTAQCTGGLTAPNIVDCSFSAQAVETATIPNAQNGEFYILLITNFSNSPTNINVTQTGGTGTTDCSILIPCDLIVDAGPDDFTCVGEAYQMNGNYTDELGNLTFEWTSTPANAVNDLDNPTILNPVFTPSQNYGTVVFELAITDDGPNEGPCTRTDEVVFTFRPLPEISVDPKTCPQADAVFNVSGSPGDELTFELNGIEQTIILDNNGLGQVIANNINTDQTLVLTNGSLGGSCPLDNNQINQVADATSEMYPIQIDTLIQFPTACGTNNGAVSGMASNFDGTPNYTWTGPGANNPAFINATVWQNLSSGWYYFSVQDNFCTITDSIFLEQDEPPVASFTATPNFGNAPLDVVFTNNSQNGDLYIWDFDNGDGNTVNNLSTQNTTYNEEGVYTVMLVAEKGECRDTAYQQVIVQLILPLIYDMPNVFTPNGDNVNDFFTINAENATKLEMIITNRWGNIVFESNDNLNPKWDGRDQKSGNQLSDGVYFYKFVITGMDGVSKTEHGYVHLVNDNN